MLNISYLDQKIRFLLTVSALPEVPLLGLDGLCWIVCRR